MKKLCVICVILGMLIPLCGCQEQIILSHRLLIRGIGVDIKENGNYLVSVHAIDVESQEENSPMLLTSEGESVLDALNSLTTKEGKRPLYSHNLIIVFGRSCAEAGLSEVLDFFIRNSEGRPNVMVFMADETAEGILSMKKGEKLIEA